MQNFRLVNFNNSKVVVLGKWNKEKGVVVLGKWNKEKGV